MGTDVFFPRINGLGVKVSTSFAEVKNVWSYASTPRDTFMAWCLTEHRLIYFVYLIQIGIIIAVTLRRYRYVKTTIDGKVVCE